MPLSLDMDYPFCLSGMFSHPIKLSPPPPILSVFNFHTRACPDLVP